MAIAPAAFSRERNGDVPKRAMVARTPIAAPDAMAIATTSVTDAISHPENMPIDAAISHRMSTSIQRAAEELPLCTEKSKGLEAQIVITTFPKCLPSFRYW
jgi:hypothetical protein